MKRKQVRRGFKVGDKVEILGYRKTVGWGGLKPERYGHIVNIDGAYILVHPRWKPKDFLVEKYPNEIRFASR